MKRLALVALISACSIQEGPSKSAVTAIGDVMRVDVTVTACNTTIQRTIELDIAAAGDEVALESLSVQQSGIVDGDLSFAPDITVPPDQGFRVRCVDRRPASESELQGLEQRESEANVIVVIATDDSSADPVLIANLATSPRSWDNCQAVFLPVGCSILSDF